MQKEKTGILPVDQSIPCDAMEGIRVVELSTHVAAPVCGRMRVIMELRSLKLNVQKGTTGVCSEKLQQLERQKRRTRILMF